MPLLALSTDMRLKPGLARRVTPRHPHKLRVAPAWKRSVKGDLTAEERAILPIFMHETITDFCAGGTSAMDVFKSILREGCYRLNWSVRMARQALRSLLGVYDLLHFWSMHPDGEDYGYDLRRMLGEAEAWLVKEDEVIALDYAGPVADSRLGKLRKAKDLHKRAVSRDKELIGTKGPREDVGAGRYAKHKNLERRTASGKIVRFANGVTAKPAPREKKPEIRLLLSPSDQKSLARKRGQKA